MTRASAWILVLAGAFVLAGAASAQNIFFADFETGTGVNDVAAWVPDNAGQIWVRQENPTTGSQALFNSIEGCGTSGNTPLPGVTDFGDGVIQLMMTAGDDDSFGIVLRQNGPDQGYLVVFGTFETPAIIFARLDDGCAATGNCLDQVTCENGGNELLQVDHGLGTTAIDLSQTLFGRIEARGDTFRVWYADLADVVDPMARDLGFPPTLEITDSTHSSGAVGVWHESMGVSYIDNVLVTGPDGIVAVEPQGKLATYWGTVKTFN